MEDYLVVLSGNERQLLNCVLEGGDGCAKDRNRSTRSSLSIPQHALPNPP